MIWAELPAPISTNLTIQARSHGIHLAAGPRFGSAGLLERFLRLPFTQAPDRLEQAIAALAQLDPPPATTTRGRQVGHYVA